eukprot:g16180.t1
MLEDDDDLDISSVASSHGEDMLGELELSSDDGADEPDFTDAFPNLNTGTGPEEAEKFGPPRVLNLLATLLFVAVAVGIVWVEFLDLEEHPSQTKETEILIVCGLFSSLLGLASLAAWMVVPRIFLFLSHALAIVTTALLGLLCVALGKGSGGLGLCLLLLAAGMALWSLCNRQKLDFAVVMLEMVVELVKQNPALLMVAVVMLIVQTVWLSLFSLACVQVLAVGGLAITFFTHALLAYFWTTYVFKNLVHCSIAGTVSHWYFRVNPSDRPVNVALDCFKLSSTYYLGAICLGSFLVVPVEIFAGPLYLLTGLRVRGCLCGGALCKRLRKCTEAIYQKCNRYAFTHVI